MLALTEYNYSDDRPPCVANAKKFNAFLDCVTAPSPDAPQPALIECELAATGERVAAVALVWSNGENYKVVPFAVLPNGDATALLNPLTDRDGKAPKHRRIGNDGTDLPTLDAMKDATLRNAMLATRALAAVSDLLAEQVKRGGIEAELAANALLTISKELKLS